MAARINKRFGKGSAARRQEKQQVETAEIYLGLTCAVAHNKLTVEGFSNEEIGKKNAFWASFKKPVNQELVAEVYAAERDFIENELAEVQLKLGHSHLEKCKQLLGQLTKEQAQTSQATFQDIECLEKKFEKLKSSRRKAWKNRNKKFRMPKIMRKKLDVVFRHVYPSFID